MFVFWAWWKLYGFPWDLRLWLAFLLHDTGYWGCPDIDGSAGQLHPLKGAALMNYFGEYWRELCLLHSGHFCKIVGKEPSKLYYADKLAFCLEPWWLYLPRVYLSGEIKEFRANSTAYLPETAMMTNRQWFEWLKVKTMEKVTGEREWNS